MRGMLRGTRAGCAFRRCGLGCVSAVARMGRGGLRSRAVRTRGGCAGGGTGLALAVPAVAAAGADQGGFGNVEAAACGDLDTAGGKLVPSTELGQRDAESVGDRDQSVA